MISVYLVAFFSGLAVMGIELSAARLIAPYFGTSLFVWTNVIGVILAALSLGYYLGGRLSEHHSTWRALFVIILLAGVLLAGIPFLIQPLASLAAFDFTTVSSASWFMLSGSFLLMVLLFFVPIMLLGMTSPYLIKIVSRDRQDLGNVSGRIFAISTLGSILGTFLPALIFIPILGTKLTILFLASLLVLVALVGLLPRRYFAVLPFLGLPLGAVNPALKSQPNLIREIESPYQYVQVIGNDFGRSLVYNEGGGVQSVWRKEETWNGGQYWDAMALLPTLTKEKQVLIIGLAAGTIARSMQKLFGSDPSLSLVGVEIDRAIIKLGRDYFELPEENLKVQVMDGRNFLQISRDQYDVIIIDAYSHQLYIPYHLATQEFFALASEHLTPGGVLAINVNAPSEDSRLLQHLGNTLAFTYPFVYRLPVRNWNYLIIAAEQPLDFSKFIRSYAEKSYEIFAQSLTEKVQSLVYDPKIRILTDDWVPVERMTDAMIWQVWRGRFEQLESTRNPFDPL